MSLAHETTGPHIHSHDSIERTMFYLVLALTPALIAGTWLFGTYSLYLTLATALASAWLEIPFAKHKYSLKRPLGDGSAFVAGMILGLSLSPLSAWWLPFAGAAILVLLGKHVFGGLGNNIFNPALVARAVLILSWPDQLAQWTLPFDSLSAATPLAGGSYSYLSLFLGNVSGSIGETSVLALLLGGAFLLMKGLTSWRVPVSVLAGAILAAVLFGIDPLFTILSGSLMLGAVFMATDMVTSPTGKTSHLVYGVGCGFLTVFIRVFTSYPEGLTFAFLIMNGVAYLMDRIGADPIFGQVELRKKRRFRILLLTGLILCSALIFSGISLGKTALASVYNSGEESLAIKRAYPEATRSVVQETYDSDVLYYRIYKEGKLLGYFASTSIKGYGDSIRVTAKLDTDSKISSVSIASQNESPNIGSRIQGRSFLTQFAGFHAENRDEIFSKVSSISGATISSMAVNNAVVRILSAQEDPAKPAEALPVLDDGQYEGQGNGFYGAISVSVTISNQRVSDIRVLDHSETDGIGPEAMSVLTERIINQQSLDVDSVSGATGSSRGFLAAVQNALSAQEAPAKAETKLPELSDGLYEGQGDGFYGAISINITVNDQRITDITVTDHNETEGIGPEAMELLIEQIIDKQSLDVDAISGATGSSRGFFAAVRNALGME